MSLIPIDRQTLRNIMYFQFIYSIHYGLMVSSHVNGFGGERRALERGRRGRGKVLCGGGGLTTTKPSPEVGIGMRYFTFFPYLPAYIGDGWRRDEATGTLTLCLP